MSAYYHAGVMLRADDPATILWSPHTRRSRTAAETEARAMMRRHGGRPLIEWWDRSWGLRPGEQEAVQDAAFVAEVRS